MIDIQMVTMRGKMQELKRVLSNDQSKRITNEAAISEIIDATIALIDGFVRLQRPVSDVINTFTAQSTL